RPARRSFMTKQRRPSKPAKAPARTASPRSSAATNAVAASQSSPAIPSRPAPLRSPPPAKPQRRTTYFEAVALYERGLETLQRHDYRAAAEMFESVLRQYPEEKELHERVRLYLNICQRQAAPREATPQTVDERLYAATLSINGGRYDEAITHLRLVRDEDPD